MRARGVILQTAETKQRAGDSPTGRSVLTGTGDGSAERAADSIAAEEKRAAMAELIGDARREAKALATGWGTAKLRLALTRAPPTVDAEALATALRSWRLAAASVGAAGAAGAAGAGATEAGATGAAEAGSAEAEAVAELREGHAVAMAEHQREVEMLVGSLRVSALRNLLGHAQCKEGCSLERAVRAWRQAAAGRL